MSSNTRNDYQLAAPPIYRNLDSMVAQIFNSVRCTFRLPSNQNMPANPRSIDRSFTVPQFNMQNSNNIRTHNDVGMHTNHGLQISERISPLLNGINSNTASIDHVYEPDQYSMCELFIERLRDMVESCGVDLVLEPVLAKHKKIMENWLKCPNARPSKKVCKIVFSILKDAQVRTEQRRTQDSDTDSSGEEPTDTSDRQTSAPVEQNGGNMDLQMQAPPQLNILGCDIKKQNSSSSKPLNLYSRLLSQRMMDPVSEIRLIQIKIKSQLKKIWNRRYITDLARENGCPPLGTKKQQEYLLIELSTLMNYNEDDLFAIVQLLTDDDKPHSTKLILPPETKATNAEISGLIINNAYGWDLSTNTILYPFKTVKYDKGHDRLKQLKVLMIKKYQHRNKGGEDVFKLRITICGRTAPGQLKRISEIKDTHLMTEKSTTNSVRDTHTIKKISHRLYASGSDQAIAALNVNNGNAGLHVMGNGIQHLPHECIDSNRDMIPVAAPQTMPDTNELCLGIEWADILEGVIPESPIPYPDQDLDIDILSDPELLYPNNNDNGDDFDNFN